MLPNPKLRGRLPVYSLDRCPRLLRWKRGSVWTHARDDMTGVRERVYALLQSAEHRPMPDTLIYPVASVVSLGETTGAVGTEVVIPQGDTACELCIPTAVDCGTMPVDRRVHIHVEAIVAQLVITRRDINRGACIGVHECNCVTKGAGERRYSCFGETLRGK